MSMRNLPARLDDEGDSLSRRQIEKARRSQASTELEVFHHALEAQALADIDAADSRAIADASRAALSEECELMDHGLALAGQSKAKAAIVARHVERMVNINDRRITGRFS